MTPKGTNIKSYWASIVSLRKDSGGREHQDKIANIPEDYEMLFAHRSLISGKEIHDIIMGYLD